MEFGIPIPRVRFRLKQLTEIAEAIYAAPKLGLSDPQASIVAKHLVDADAAGYESHGLQRTLRYITAVLDGHLTPAKEPKLLIPLDNCPCARIEAKHTLGRLGMEAVVDTALELGKRFHCAHVGTLTYHIGRMQPYLRRIAQAGYLVQCQVNAVGKPTVSTLTRLSRLGTNPFGMGVPREHLEPLTLDFTPASSTEGNMRVFHAANQQAPAGILTDAEGKATRDPGVLYAADMADSGAILPAGGERRHALAHLLTMLEVGPGALFNNISASSPKEGQIRGMNAVMLSIVHPKAFGIDMNEYLARVEQTCDFIRASPPMDPRYADETGKVLLPGEYEAMMLRKSRREGILLSAATWTELQEAAETLEVSDKLADIKPSEELDA